MISLLASNLFIATVTFSSTRQTMFRSGPFGDINFHLSLSYFISLIINFLYFYGFMALIFFPFFSSFPILYCCSLFLKSSLFNQRRKKNDIAFMDFQVFSFYVCVFVFVCICSLCIEEKKKIKKREFVSLFIYSFLSLEF